MKKFNVKKLPKWAREKINFIEWNEEGEIADNAAGIVYTKEQYKFDDGNTTLFYNKKDLLEMLKLFEEKTEEEKQNESKKTCIEINKKETDFKSFFENFK